MVLCIDIFPLKRKPTHVVEIFRKISAVSSKNVIIGKVSDSFPLENFITYFIFMDMSNYSQN